MPIHLPPISRREFFARSLLAAAGLALAPSLLAASRRVDANSWALLADTHIAGDQARIARGINMAGHLKCVAREVLALPKRPVGLFVLSLIIGIIANVVESGLVGIGLGKAVIRTGLLKSYPR